MSIPSRVLVWLAAVSPLVTACGSDHSGHGSSGASAESAADAATSIDIEMRDIEFDQTELSVDAGTLIRFVFTNIGKIPHDGFIGDEAAQAGHEQEMASMGDMGGHSMHDDDAITVAPGATGELTYTFDEPGTYEIGCHQVGHYAAGMKITVNVVA
jgi:uncharacterized cupredoxin-like copper-binding protein